MKSFLRSLAIGALLCTAFSASAAVTVGVDPGAPWKAWMNWSELPENGGAYITGSPWTAADLPAVFSGPVLTLAPNSINDPSSYWYQGGGAPGHPGNKTMEANLYLEDLPGFAGDTVTFKGDVLANTLIKPWASYAVIKEFTPSWGWIGMDSVNLTPGAFSVSRLTGAGNHVQVGLMTVGPPVWITDAPEKGFVKVAATGAVPEPSTLALFASSAIGLLALRRNRKA